MGQHASAEIKENYIKKSCIALNYGEIVEIPEKLGRLRVEWKIPDFLSLKRKGHRTVFSPIFNFLQADYQLRIFLFCDQDTDMLCDIYLFFEDSEKPDICTVAIRQVDGTVDRSCSNSNGVSFNSNDLLEKQFTWLSSGVLNVTVEIQRTEASEVKTHRKKEPEVEVVSDRKKVKETSKKKDPEVEVVSDSKKVKETSKKKELEGERVSDSKKMKETSKKKELEGERVSDSKKMKETPESKEPEVEVVWDSRKVKAKEPELICLSDDSDEEGETETIGLRVVSQGTQTTEDFLFSTEHERLEAKSISKLTKHLEDLLLEGRDHDVTIKVKNRPFKAHKAVLQARSPVFLSMFQHDMEERASGVVTMDDCDPGVFDQFLKHVYTGKFEMDSAKSAIALHYAADKYDFPELKEACIRYLSNSFTTNTVCDVIKMAAIHDENQLLHWASMFFERNLEEILKTAEWQIFLHNDSTMANELLLQAVLSRSERPEQKKITVCVECPSCSVKRK